jgi:hypothetical protein
MEKVAAGTIFPLSFHAERNIHLSERNPTFPSLPSRKNGHYTQQPLTHRKAP